MAKSPSMKFREEGNSVFSTVDDYKNVSIMEDRLLKAAKLYNQALSSAKNNSETSSARKNLGMTYAKLFEINYQEKYRELARQNYLEGLKSGRTSQSVSWTVNLSEKVIQLLEMDKMERGMKIQLYLRLFNSRHSWECENSLLFLVLNELASWNLTCSIKKLEEIDKIENQTSKLEEKGFMIQKFNDLQSHIEHTREYISFVRQLPYYNLEKMDEWASSIGYIEKALESLKMLYQSLTCSALNEFWDAADWAKFLMTNTKITIYEARAQFELASAYFQINSETFSQKIRELLNSSVHIASSNNVPFNTHWFAKARNLLIYFQENEKKKEDNAAEDRRKKLYEDPEIKKKLDELIETRKNRPAKEVVKKLYELFPPGNGAQCPADDEMTVSTMKKTLQKKVLLLYHPDKNQKGGKYSVDLCNEITQIMNEVYDAFK